MTFFESKKFQIIMIVSSVALVFGVVGSLSLVQYLKYREQKKIENQIKEAKIEYEEGYRQTMAHIFQNLQLDHFLAAYKYLHELTPPDHSDAIRVQEYTEVLERVGRGLLANQLLKEAEEIFESLRSYEGESTANSNDLNQVESKKQLETARLLLSEGESLLRQKRYRDALGELKKSETELNNIEFLKFDDVKDERAELKRLMSIARFYTYLEDADTALLDANRKLKTLAFKAFFDSESKAAKLIARSEFLRPGSEEVKRIRDRLWQLDAEAAFVQPNSLPIKNILKKEDVGTGPYYFYLAGYDFGNGKATTDGKIKVGIKFVANANDSFYVARYRIFFFGTGRTVFNGHFLTNKELPVGPGEENQIYFDQEIPEPLRKEQISRIELRIYDLNGSYVAGVSRAFRKPNS